MLLVQVWENCRMYNPVGTAVRQMGDRLSETWEKKWYQSSVEPRWEGLMRELTEEEVPLLFPPSTHPINTLTTCNKYTPLRAHQVIFCIFWLAFYQHWHVNQ